MAMPGHARFEGGIFSTAWTPLGEAARFLKRRSGERTAAYSPLPPRDARDAVRAAVLPWRPLIGLLRYGLLDPVFWSFVTFQSD